MTSLLAFIDFSKEDMPDISNHGATASPHGSCGVMNLVPVYLPSKESSHRSTLEAISIREDLRAVNFLSMSKCISDLRRNRTR